MKGIKRSAKDELIARARLVANQRKSTLNALRRESFADWVSQQDRAIKWRELDVRLGEKTSYGRHAGCPKYWFAGNSKPFHKFNL